jgi:1-acyl-sn-glycerol-3-phosphate acyltransferase
MVLNHTSWLDILLMMAIAEDIPGFVAKVGT